MNACAALVVLEFPALKVVYQDLRMVQLTLPYIPGYLAFRECPFFVDALQRLRATKPELYPQLLMIDGNGVFHPRGAAIEFLSLFLSRYYTLLIGLLMCVCSSWNSVSS